MTNRTFQIWIAISVASMFLVVGCGAGVSANASPSIDREMITAATMPMVTTDWELTVARAHAENELAGFKPGYYKPDAGYTYLVVDVTLRNTNASQPTRLSTNAFSVIDSAGHANPCIGIGYTKLNRYDLSNWHVLNSQENSMDDLALVFGVNENQIHQPWKFQFRDAPPLVLQMDK